MKALLHKLAALVWPITKRKLHGLVSLVGTAFAAFAVVAVWAASLGLTTTGKIGATVGLVTTYAASWNSLRPKLEKGIDALPIPDGSTITQTETASLTTTISTPPAPTPPKGTEP